MILICSNLKLILFYYNYFYENICQKKIVQIREVCEIHELGTSRYYRYYILFKDTQHKNNRKKKIYLGMCESNSFIK